MAPQHYEIDWSFDLCTVRSLVKGPEPCKIGVMHAKKVKPPQEMEIKIAVRGSYALKIRREETRHEEATRTATDLQPGSSLRPPGEHLPPELLLVVKVLLTATQRRVQRERTRL